MSDREPLSDEELHLNAAALAAHPKMISPDDAEMAGVCEGLADRGDLARVFEGEGKPDPETDRVVGYVASEGLRAAMLQRGAMN